MRQDALMLEFQDAHTAQLAADTYRELGYDPCDHGGGRLHIHVRGEDLTSALEILQSLGGRIVESEPSHSADAFNMAYSLDVIPIPAHIVNEDLNSDSPQMTENASAFAAQETAFDAASAETADEQQTADYAPYNHFPAT